MQESVDEERAGFGLEKNYGPIAGIPGPRGGGVKAVRDVITRVLVN